MKTTINNIADFLNYCKTNNLTLEQIDLILQQVFKVYILNANYKTPGELLNHFEAYYNKWLMSGEIEHPLFLDYSEARLLPTDININ
jgi:hypothetical protein